MRNEEFDAILKKSIRLEPNFHLSVDFAHKVVYSIARREQWKSDLIEYLTLTAFLLALLMVVGGFYYYLDKVFILQVVSFVSGNVIQVVFTVFILNFILLTDKVLLRLLFSRFSKGV